MVVELKLKMLNMQKVTISTLPPGVYFELLLHFALKSIMSSILTNFTKILLHVYQVSLKGSQSFVYPAHHMSFRTGLSQ